MKIKFENLTDNSKILLITVPLFTPVTKNPDDETDEQIMDEHERFLNLPERAKDKLASTKTSEIIQKIGRNFNLELLQLGDIARAIRSYYFGKLKLEDMPFVLAKEMNMDLTKAKEITRIVIDKIINDALQEKAYQDSLEKLLLPEVIKKYSEIGEQLITSDKIKIKNFPEPARPSLKNWIADYTFLMGREKRGMIERGKYLFKSENGKNLSSSDRQHLNYILKCLDENSAVTINKITKQILFPQVSENIATPSTRPTQPPIEPKNNIQSIQFSYPQKPVSPNYQKMHVAPPVVIPKQEIRSSFGPNVVNLKD